MDPPHSASQDAFELLALTASWVLTTAASVAIVIRDERRLSPLGRERAWPAVSRDCSIFAFGQIAVVVHFIRTRRTWWSPLAGLCAAALASLPSVALEIVLSLLLPAAG